MHVALLSGEYPPEPGGLGDYTRCLVAALSEQGLFTSVVTLRDEALVVYRGATLDPVLKSRRIVGWDWSCWPAVIELLDRLRPDVLHLQYQTGAYAMHPALNFLPWRLHGLRPRPQVVVTFHDLLVPYLFPKAGRLRNYVNWRLAGDADAVIVTNSSDAEQLAPALAHVPQHIPIGSNIAVATASGYDRRAWRAALGVSPEETLLAYFGLLSPSKGAEDLLAALAALPSTVRLVLIGGAATSAVDRAYSATFAALIQAYGLEQRILRTGHVSAEIVSAHLCAADIVVLPFRDGASLRRGSLLAAMAHGCCVISTRPAERATQDLLQHGVNLYLVDRAEELHGAITSLINDKMVCTQLGAAAQLFAQQFSWEAIATAHLALYDRTLTRGHGEFIGSVRRPLRHRVQLKAA
ncbi:glycosyltransferase [Candidatus Gracilibacteria bacterium]|nr:glycosyltransferase [Candidatus Gracilibacteria bacterium]